MKYRHIIVYLFVLFISGMFFNGSVYAVRFDPENGNDNKKESSRPFLESKKSEKKSKKNSSLKKILAIAGSIGLITTGSGVAAWIASTHNNEVSQSPMNFLPPQRSYVVGSWNTSLTSLDCLELGSKSTTPNIQNLASSCGYKISKDMIDNVMYCIPKVSEGANGTLALIENTKCIMGIEDENNLGDANVKKVSKSNSRKRKIIEDTQSGGNKRKRSADNPLFKKYLNSSKLIGWGKNGYFNKHGDVYMGYTRLSPEIQSEPGPLECMMYPVYDYDRNHVLVDSTAQKHKAFENHFISWQQLVRRFDFKFVKHFKHLFDLHSVQEVDQVKNGTLTVKDKAAPYIKAFSNTKWVLASVVGDAVFRMKNKWPEEYKKQFYIEVPAKIKPIVEALADINVDSSQYRCELDAVVVQETTIVTMDSKFRLWPKTTDNKLSLTYTCELDDVSNELTPMKCMGRYIKSVMNQYCWLDSVDRAGMRLRRALLVIQNMVWKMYKNGDPESKIWLEYITGGRKDILEEGLAYMFITAPNFKAIISNSAKNNGDIWYQSMSKTLQDYFMGTVQTCRMALLLDSSIDIGDKEGMFMLFFNPKGIDYTEKMLADQTTEQNINMLKKFKMNIETKNLENLGFTSDQIVNEFEKKTGIKRAYPQSDLKGFRKPPFYKGIRFEQLTRWLVLADHKRFAEYLFSLNKAKFMTEEEIKNFESLLASLDQELNDKFENLRTNRNYRGQEVKDYKILESAKILADSQFQTCEAYYNNKYNSSSTQDTRMENSTSASTKGIRIEEDITTTSTQDTHRDKRDIDENEDHNIVKSGVSIFGMYTMVLDLFNQKNMNKEGIEKWVSSQLYLFDKKKNGKDQGIKETRMSTDQYSIIEMSADDILKDIKCKMGELLGVIENRSIMYQARSDIQGDDKLNNCNIIFMEPYSSVFNTIQCNMVNMMPLEFDKDKHDLIVDVLKRLADKYKDTSVEEVLANKGDDDVKLLESFLNCKYHVHKYYKQFDGLLDRPLVFCLKKEQSEYKFEYVMPLTLAVKGQLNEVPNIPVGYASVNFPLYILLSLMREMYGHKLDEISSMPVMDSEGKYLKINDSSQQFKDLLSFLLNNKEISKDFTEGWSVLYGRMEKKSVYEFAYNEWLNRGSQVLCKILPSQRGYKNTQQQKNSTIAACELWEMGNLMDDIEVSLMIKTILETDGME